MTLKENIMPVWYGMAAFGETILLVPTYWGVFLPNGLCYNHKTPY